MIKSQLELGRVSGNIPETMKRTLVVRGLGPNLG